MKKILSIIIFTVLFSMLFIACSNEVTESKICQFTIQNDTELDFVPIVFGYDGTNQITTEMLHTYSVSKVYTISSDKMSIKFMYYGKSIVLIEDVNKPVKVWTLSEFEVTHIVLNANCTSNEITTQTGKLPCGMR